MKGKEDRVAETCAHLFHFTADKAGMKRDRSEVNQVIFDMSKNSQYFKNAQNKDEKTQTRVLEMKKRVEMLTDAELLTIRKDIYRQARKVKQPSQIICVVDMDMFFAAVEMRDNTSLIGKPVAVGGPSMISTANYEARKYGVRSAMPGFIAVKLMPKDVPLIFIRPHMEKYKAASEEIMTMFKTLDPNLSCTSLDEAVLDLDPYLTNHFPEITEYRERMVKAGEVIMEMLNKVAIQTRLTCSAGIAPTKMLAKIASDVNKPHGLKVVFPEELLSFARSLPIRNIPGIGRSVNDYYKNLLVYPLFLISGTN